MVYCGEFKVWRVLCLQPTTGILVENYKKSLSLLSLLPLSVLLPGEGPTHIGLKWVLTVLCSFERTPIRNLLAGQVSQALLPEVHTPVSQLLIMPTTKAQMESSFSDLQRVETFLSVAYCKRDWPAWWCMIPSLSTRMSLVFLMWATCLSRDWEQQQTLLPLHPMQWWPCLLSAKAQHFFNTCALMLFRLSSSKARCDMFGHFRCVNTSSCSASLPHLP